jgi:hypothetical protein
MAAVPSTVTHASATPSGSSTVRQTRGSERMRRTFSEWRVVNMRASPPFHSYQMGTAVGDPSG